MVNAVVHRDYSRSGETVRVFMFPDRVEVRSPGGLPPELTIDDVVELRATSVPRNEVLAGFLRDIPGYMERVGSGLRFMVTEMREAGLPDPEFSDHLDFMVTFRNGQATEAPSGLSPRQVIGLTLWWTSVSAARFFAKRSPGPVKLRASGVSWKVGGQDKSATAVLLSGEGRLRWRHHAACGVIRAGWGRTQACSGKGVSQPIREGWPMETRMIELLK